MLVDCIQLIVVQPGIKRLAHRQRINIGVRKIDAGPFARTPDKEHIKAAGIVGNQDVIPTEFLELADRFLRAGGVCHHRIVDAGQLHDPRRDRPAGVDEGAKLLFFVDLTILNKDRADFGQAVAVGVQASRFGIENNEAA